MEYHPKIQSAATAFYLELPIQVRRFYEHNRGAADQDIAMKIAGHQPNTRRKYVIDQDEMSAFIDGMF